MSRLFSTPSLLLCSLCLGAHLLFAQVETATPNDSVRVSVTLNQDGSRTVYKFDPPTHRPTATTTGANGKPAGKIEYVLDEVGRFSGGEVFGADGKSSSGLHIDMTRADICRRRVGSPKTVTPSASLSIVTMRPANRPAIRFSMALENSSVKHPLPCLRRPLRSRGRAEDKRELASHADARARGHQQTHETADLRLACD